MSPGGQFAFLTHSNLTGRTAHRDCLFSFLGFFHGAMLLETPPADWSIWNAREELSLVVRYPKHCVEANEGP